MTTERSYVSRRRHTFGEFRYKVEKLAHECEEKVHDVCDCMADHVKHFFTHVEDHIPFHHHHRDSSPQKPERAPCVPPQPSSRRGVSEHAVKSYSLDGGSRTSPGRSTRTRSTGSSGYQQTQGKARVSPRANDDVLKKTRMQTAYELSQDLADKQLEMLERKYGGPVRARNAALTIQRAFRRYAMERKFSIITQQAKQEKRLSRRFQTVDLGAPSADTWLVGASTPTVGEWNRSESERGVIKSDLSQLYRDLDDLTDHCRHPRPTRSHSMKETQTKDNSAYPISLRYEGWTTSTPKSTGWYEGGVDDSVYHSPCWSGVGVENTSNDHSIYHTPRESLSTDSGISSLYEQKQDSRRKQGTPPSRRGPPDVPKRISSLGRTDDMASLSSGGSDSSLSVCAERTTEEGNQSPIPNNTWKRKLPQSSCDHSMSAHIEDKRLSNISETSEDSMEAASGNCNHSHCHTYQTTPPSHPTRSQPLYKVPEVIRKRQYRVGLNLFNKKPEKGITYLIRRGFLDASPQSVAKFLISRKGLSKQMIGEYLGNLQNQFNMAVLECFACELDLSGLQVDVALRRFQTYFRLPGEAQKIERLVEVFAQHFCRCNRDIISRLENPDTIFVLAFAVIMLNTDLHTPNIKPDRKMKQDDFIKNLRGVDEGNDIDRETLVGIYERIRGTEFRPGSDHVTQVMKVQQTIVGKKPHLALPHRRLVCYCRLYEVPDVHKKERPGVHQREVFLFNDLLVVTKIFSKKKNSVTYSFRQSFPLCGLQVTVFQVPNYQFGIRLSTRVDGKLLVTFNARNEHDRSKFVEDLKESICEMDEMENLRIEAGLERQQRNARMRTAENRDSGVADVEVLPNGKESTSCNGNAHLQVVKSSSQEGNGLKRSALSNSLLDIHDIGEKPQRRGSIGSLDSGMSVSFQSSSNSTVSRDSSPQAVAPKSSQQSASFLGFFDRSKKDARKLSKPDIDTETFA